MAIKLKYQPVGGPLLASYATGVGQATQRRRKYARDWAALNLRSGVNKGAYYEGVRHHNRLVEIAAAAAARREDWDPSKWMPGGSMIPNFPLPGGVLPGGVPIRGGATPPSTPAPSTPGVGTTPTTPTAPTAPVEHSTFRRHRPRALPDTVARGDEAKMRELKRQREIMDTIEHSTNLDRESPEVQDTYNQAYRKYNEIYDSLAPVSDAGPPETREDRRKDYAAYEKAKNDVLNHNAEQEKNIQEAMKGDATTGTGGMSRAEAERLFPKQPLPPEVPFAPRERPAPAYAAPAMEYATNLLKAGTLSPSQYRRVAMVARQFGFINEDEETGAMKLAKRQEAINTIRKLEKKYPHAETIKDIGTSAERKEFRAAEEYLKHGERGYGLDSIKGSLPPSTTVYGPSPSGPSLSAPPSIEDQRQQNLNTIMSIARKYPNAATPEDIPSSSDREAYVAAMNAMKELDRQVLTSP